jgi:membrane-bound lytic murein transglycosylase A
MAAEASPLPPDLPGAERVPLRFDQIAGWQDDRHDLAFAAFRRGCAAAPALRAGLPPPPGLAPVCAAALATLSDPDPASARAFFERWFSPFAIRTQAAGGAGFLTGYYEPEFPASLTASSDYPSPLYGRPADLVTRAQDEIWTGPLAGLEAARRLADGSLVPYPTRSEIDQGAASPDWPVLAYMRDPVDRFVMQVQGSGRLKLPDGRALRVAYAGRNGHPYVSLGRVMAQADNVPPAEMTMDRLVARLKGDPGGRLLWSNPSFVFFRIAEELSVQDGPIGGAGVPLTPHRSVAADRRLWPYGIPLWLDGAIPTATRGVDTPLRRLTIVQDTGSAIVGPARFDLFHGSGDEAGFVAGLTRHPVAATILWPREAPR